MLARHYGIQALTAFWGTQIDGDPPVRGNQSGHVASSVDANCMERHERKKLVTLTETRESTHIPQGAGRTQSFLDTPTLDMNSGSRCGSRGNGGRSQTRWRTQERILRDGRFSCEAEAPVVPLDLTLVSTPDQLDESFRERFAPTEVVVID